MLNIAVIGGSGFIGTRLVSALLAAGHQVRIYDKAPSARHAALVTMGDVRDRAALSRFVAGSDCLINLAAEHADDVRPISLYEEVNVGGARNVIAAAAEHDVRSVLYVSSVAVYGLHQPMAHEQSPLRPDSHYGRSKVAAEAVYTQWAQQQSTRALFLLRPVVVFGEGNRGNVHTLIDHLRRRRFLMVGHGRNRKSMAYVGNLVDFICSQLGFAPGIQICNYADKPDLSTGELVQRIRELLPQSGRDGLHVPYALALLGGWTCDLLALLSRRKLDVGSARIRKFCADTRIATEVVQASGFTQACSIDEGLARMVQSILRDSETRQSP